MKKKCKVIAITNQKGGVGKTVTTVSLGVSLAQLDNRVLLIDFDPQGNLSKGLGYGDKNKYKLSLKDVFMNEILENEYYWKDSIIYSNEEVELIPSNIDLSGTDLALSNVMSRENVLRQFVDKFKDNYDYILIDCNPALNLFTINALTASDSVIIPVQTEPYATDGLNDLLRTIHNVKQKLNPNIQIDGILMTMFDVRTNLSKHIAKEVQDNYGGKINIFKSIIPRCVAAAEAPLSGLSPILYSPKAESTIAYKRLAKEVTEIGKEITKSKTEHIR